MININYALPEHLLSHQDERLKKELTALTKPYKFDFGIKGVWPNRVLILHFEEYGDTIQIAETVLKLGVIIGRIIAF